MLDIKTKNKIYETLEPTIGKDLLQEKIDLFEKLISLSPICSELGNLDNLIFNGLNNNFYDLMSINYNEQIFKLILYIVDKETYNYIIDNHKGLASVYKALKVMTNDEIKLMCNGKSDDDDAKTIFYTSINDVQDKFAGNEKILPYVKGYIFRNEAAHVSIKYDMPTKMTYYFSVLLTCINTAWKYRDKILDAYISNNISFKEYINKIINSYENQKIFTYIPSTVTPWKNTLNDTKIKDDNCLIDIIKNYPELNKIKIIGYAGAGKTTTLRYLEYQDSINCRNNGYKKTIPVLISLINIQNNTENLNDFLPFLIMNRLSIYDKQIINHLIVNKRINLYLDGINEICVNNVRPILDTIERYVKKTSIKVIVSDRDSDANSCLNDIPTFILRTMDDNDIKKFIYGNSENPDDVYKKIMESVDNNPSLHDEITHPFMLKRLISIIECNKEIPSNSKELTGMFINSLIEREQVEKHDQNALYINRLLTYLACDDKSIGSMDIFYILSRFNECKDKYKFEVDSDKVLELIVKLGLLRRIDLDTYVFAEDNFSDYYFTKAADAGLI